jgi:hypothetical protein
MSIYIRFECYIPYTSLWTQLDNAKLAYNLVKNIINEIIFQELGEDIPNYKLIFRSLKGSKFFSNGAIYLFTIKKIPDENISLLDNSKLNHRDRKLLLNHWITVSRNLVFNNIHDKESIYRLTDLLDNIICGKIYIDKST